MNDKEQCPITGILKLKITNAQGAVIQESEEKNLIVNTGTWNLSRLLGAAQTTRHIDRISFGENNSAAAAGDTSLTNPFTKNVDSVSYPTTRSVEFGFSLAYTEANGKNIYEMGLLHANNDLFNRKVRGLIAKDSDIRIDGTWTITF